MQLPEAVLAFDTSNYTTSIALMDTSYQLLDQRRQLLTVTEGKRGLRQSEALFQHVRELPVLLKSMESALSQVCLKAVGYSNRPRDIEGSYMPVFLAGESLARSVAVIHQVPCFSYSHQEGHLAAGLWSLGLEMNRPFYALHLSGGTTELLRVAPTREVGYTAVVVAQTSDISLGQLIDRLGVAMGLSFPAGPALEKLAQKNELPLIEIPFSIHQNQNSQKHGCHLELSLSGPETFLQRCLQSGMHSNEQLAASIFHFSGILLGKLMKKAWTLEPLTSLLTVGGVASNCLVRETMETFLKKLPLTIHHAQQEFCSDNAAGTAVLTAAHINQIFTNQ
ncbi:O-sialoglycoprotein endopeptidase [Anoxynatronum buryatiense]|uniref:N(6)-L-threonylcarbamoyladenine synthase n=1 Tax=Anoxynatronum buryatiense TaxID=489973 RepID=A0AA46AIE9_9CLOT|nr:O-sialoglycoprotein endopeptidase [Anoxynatronum buryatiense]SMP48483.1 N6-L-threonylcarbamoyladenine synthase [Anoxynatronum buryatiense]